MENNEVRYGDASLGFDSNVSLKLFDKETNRLVEERNIHNKATVAMVQGILSMLKGTFTGSNYYRDKSNLDEIYK